jgi:hypothetical protein
VELADDRCIARRFDNFLDGRAKAAGILLGQEDRNIHQPRRFDQDSGVAERSSRRLHRRNKTLLHVDHDQRGFHCSY